MQNNKTLIAATALIFSLFAIVEWLGESAAKTLEAIL